VQATVAECPDHQDLVAFLDGRMPPRATQSVREHVERCSSCKTVVGALGQSVRAAENAALLLRMTETGDTLASSERVRSWSLPPGDPSRYVRLDEVARGGLGRIVRAHDLHLDRQVALKESLVGEMGQARFAREALITARLQHPSIVPVHEAGRWPSGEPYYAMKLVSGRPLDAVIEKTTSLDQRLALLPNVIAVADAIAYAHGARVIHRDLKPSNVLVGAYGETVVIDWGMAKDLGAPDEAPLPTGGGGDGLTVTGSIMGTPEYMPPEQAEGKPVNEGADVYALGALLYCVLTGAPPYQGPKILSQVLEGPPPPIQERQPNIPPDLATIVGRAMERRAEDRYPSARDLAEDLRRFQTGQLVAAHHYSRATRLSRWLRKHRAPVTVAVVMFAVLIALGVAGLRRILDERARANRARDDAEALLDYVSNDLYTTLEPVGQVRALDSVTARTLAYFEKLAPQDRGPSSELHRAAALRHRGNVLLALGQASAARTSFEGARQLAAAQLAHAPGDPAWTSELASSWWRLSEVMNSQGDLPAALSAAREALALQEAASARTPGDEQLQVSVATSHWRVGLVLERQGDLAGALASYRRSHELVSPRAAREPVDSIALARALDSLRSIGDVLETQGKLDEALASFRALLAGAERLAAAAPDDLRRQYHVGTALSRIGGVLETKGDYAGAMAAYRKDLAISERLSAHDPSNTTWRNDLAVTWNRVGSVLQAQGDLPGALDAYRKTLAIQEPLAALDPSDLELQRGVAVMYGWIGGVLEKQRDLQGALDAYRQYDAISGRLAAHDATNVGWQDDLLVARRRLAQTLLALGDTAGARQVVDDTVRTMEASVRAHGDVLGTTWGRFQLVVGNLEAASGRADAARQAWTRSVDALAPVARDKIAAAQSALAQSLLHLGRVDEARPWVDALRLEQHDDPELWKLVRAAGL
jgi:tetratricopeptide (TPR) repeat protein